MADNDTTWALAAKEKLDTINITLEQLVLLTDAVSHHVSETCDTVNRWVQICSVARMVGDSALLPQNEVSPR
jgi:hypothetical protein